MNYLGQLYHPNLVKLIGYCLEDEQRLLVYEFMPRGSLENHLFRSKFFERQHWIPLKQNGFDYIMSLTVLNCLYQEVLISNLFLGPYG